MEKFNNVKADVLITGALITIRNAQDLCAEAELLHNNRMFARSYALSNFAREEFAKSLMLNKLCIDVMAGYEVDWKKIRKRLLDHKEKHANDLSMTDALFYQSADGDRAKIRKYRLSKDFIDHKNRRKNASLYVDWDGGKFVSPNDNFTERQSYRNLELAKAIIVSVSPMVLTLVDLADKTQEEIREKFPADKIKLMIEKYNDEISGI